MVKSRHFFARSTIFAMNIALAIDQSMKHAARTFARENPDVVREGGGSTVREEKFCRFQGAALPYNNTSSRNKKMKQL